MVSPNQVVEDTVAHNVSEDESKQERTITSDGQILLLFGWWYHANKVSVLLDLIGSATLVSVYGFVVQWR